MPKVWDHWEFRALQPDSQSLHTLVIKTKSVVFGVSFPNVPEAAPPNSRGSHSSLSEKVPETPIFGISPTLNPTMSIHNAPSSSNFCRSIDFGSAIPTLYGFTPRRRCKWHFRFPKKKCDFVLEVPEGGAGAAQIKKRPEGRPKKYCSQSFKSMPFLVFEMFAEHIKKKKIVI